MPIKIPDTLPAREVLICEGVDVMTETDAIRQDIRPLRIGLLNLMPNKIRTETQIARLLGASPLQIELTLVRVGSHKAKTTSEDHLIAHYQKWEDIADQKFDGFIVTGAPIETLPFEDVVYWQELTQIFDWIRTNVHSPFYICWGAMAAAWHFHKLPKYELREKAFGIYRHLNLLPSSPYLTGFSDDFQIPVSRHTEVRRTDIERLPNLKLLIDSEYTGPCLISEPQRRSLYIFNHIEYDSTSLKEEYDRDKASGKHVRPPHNYYPNDDLRAAPMNRWRSHAHLLFGNWINQVYQTTPYDLLTISHRSSSSVE
ncbi:MAG: homoserine O-succinyltransferase [Pseudomonadota bacterium]